MIKKHNKGFTIVELVIVIAVIAILAGVLVPTFSGVIKKANISHDTQVVSMLNKSVKADLAYKGQAKHDTMYDAVQACALSGIKEKQIVAKSDYNIGWNAENGEFALLDLANNSVFYPEEASMAGKEESYYIVTTYDERIEKDANFKYSIYAYGDWSQNSTLKIHSNFDAGSAEGIEKVVYENLGEAKNIVIRTNSFKTSMEINAPQDTIKHYGEVGHVNILSVADHSYVEYGNGAIVQVKDGHVTIASEADIAYIHITKKSDKEFDAIKITIENGAKLPQLTRDSIVTSSSDVVKICTVETNDKSEDIYLTKQGIAEQIKMVAEGTDFENVTASQCGRYAEYVEKPVENQDDKQNSAANMLANDLNGVSRSNANGKIVDAVVKTEGEGESEVKTIISFNEETRELVVETKTGNNELVIVEDTTLIKNTVELVIEEKGKNNNEVESYVQQKVGEKVKSSVEELVKEWVGENGKPIGTVTLYGINHGSDKKELTDKSSDDLFAGTYLAGKLSYTKKTNTLKLLDDVKIGQIDLKVGKDGGTLVLDLNGHVLTCNSWTGFDIHGGYELYIVDSNTTAVHEGSIFTQNHRCYGVTYNAYTWSSEDSINDWTKVDSRTITGGIITNLNGNKNASGVGAVYDGGAISTENDVKLHLVSGTIAGIDSDSDTGAIVMGRSHKNGCELTMENGFTIIGCTGGETGAIELQGDTKLVLNGGRIEYCSGCYNLAINAWGSSVVTVNNVTIANCKSLNSTTVMYIWGVKDVTSLQMNGGTIENCDADTIIWGQNGNGVIDGGTLKNCRSNANGIIHLQGTYDDGSSKKTYTINNLTITQCTCLGSCGIFDQNDNKLVINNCLISKNNCQATWLFCCNDAELEINGGTFSDNIVNGRKDAGARIVRRNNAQLKVSGGEFTNNRDSAGNLAPLAESEGGATIAEGIESK